MSPLRLFRVALSACRPGSLYFILLSADHRHAMFDSTLRLFCVARDLGQDAETRPAARPPNIEIEGIGSAHRHFSVTVMWLAEVPGRVGSGPEWHFRAHQGLEGPAWKSPEASIMTQKGLEGRDGTGRPWERSETRRTARKAWERARNGLGGAGGQPRSV